MNKLTWIEIIEHIKISQFQPFILYYYYIRYILPLCYGYLSVCVGLCVYIVTPYVTPVTVSLLWWETVYVPQ